MVSEKTEKTVNILGCAAIFGLVELSAVVMAAMITSKEILSLINILSVSIPLIPLIFYYKHRLGFKNTIIGFIIGTSIIGAFFVFLKFGFG